MAQTTHTDLSLRLTLDDLIMASSWDKSKHPTIPSTANLKNAR